MLRLAQLIDEEMGETRRPQLLSGGFKQETSAHQVHVDTRRLPE